MPQKDQDLIGEEPKMRLIAFFLAVLVASVPAAAEGWKEYNYPDYSFTVSFPAPPRSKPRFIKAPTAALLKRMFIPSLSVKRYSR
jgi:hypothetical protein